MTSLPDETTKQRISLKQPPGVFLFQGEQLTSGLTDVGKDQLYSPHLPPGAQVAPPAKRELFGKKKSVLTEGREDGVCV